jgi:hypothetical protein
MEKSFNPNAKITQGQLSTAADGKQPNQPTVNIDFSKHAPVKGEADNALKDINYPSKSGSEHMQSKLFDMADEKDY